MQTWNAAAAEGSWGIRPWTVSDIHANLIYEETQSIPLRTVELGPSLARVLFLPVASGQYTLDLTFGGIRLPRTNLICCLITSTFAFTTTFI